MLLVKEHTRVDWNEHTRVDWNEHTVLAKINKKQRNIHYDCNQSSVEDSKKKKITIFKQILNLLCYY